MGVNAMLRKFCAVFAVVAVSFTGAQIIGESSASAYPTANVELTGHGFGHGRGMGQYGALGYAVDDNWSYQQILDRYYGGTSFGGSAGDPTIGVRITGADGIDMILTAGVPFTVGGQAFAANEGARVRKTGSNAFAIDKSANCGGGGGWNQVGTSSGGVTANSSSSGSALTDVLQLCMPSATRGYRGVLQAIDDNGTARVVNSLAVQQYLRGVLPRESPASWADLGGGRGAQALRAQAVAARSYVLAAASYSYATTCDTTACQVYGGAYLNGAYIEDARSDAAIDATAGQVRRNGAGNAMRTEFSSSTGGYTAGGTFPAVVDDGDDYSGNPNHNWSASIPVSQVQSAYPSIGTLQSISIDSRNGLGDFGGRVTGMTLVGSNGNASITGADFRAKLGLKSDWFQVSGTPSGGTNGYWMAGGDGGIFSYGAAQFYGSMGGRPLNKPVVNFAAAPNSGGYWLVASDGGIFTYGSSKFFGSMGGKPLNRPIVGMTPTPSGNGYWLVASDGGVFAYGDAKFFGSMGGKPLNRPIVGITATPSGNGYWMVASDGGIFAYGDANFFGSTGNISLRQPVVGIASTPSGAGYWMVAADGGVFAYGDAGFFGSLPSAKVNATVTGIARTQTGGGYMLSTNRGAIYSFGDAPYFGNLPSSYRGTVLAVAPTYQ